MELLKLTESEFSQIAKVVYDKTGIHLPPEKLSLLSNRLRKRLRALDLAGFEDYYRLISSKSGCEEELPHFLSAVTTNETYFFRNEQLWKFFTTELVKHFVETKGRTKSLRIWSAAASSGEEAHTAAIALREHLPDCQQWQITVVGSDISQRVLDHARKGVYSEYSVSRMPAAHRERWFDKQEGEYHLKDEIRKMVKFVFHNLRDPFPDGRFDLVFLRNVLMYFDMEMKKCVLRVVSDAVVPGGYLIVGDVDPIRTVPELSRCMTLEYKRPGAYQKPLAQGAGSAKREQMVHA